MLLSHTAPPVPLGALRPCKLLSQGCVSARTSKPLPRLACSAAEPAKVRLRELHWLAVQQALLQSELVATILSPFAADSTSLRNVPYYLRNLLLAQADASVQELLQDLDNLLEMLPKAHGTPKPALEVNVEAEEDPATMLFCDVSGCSIVPVSHAQASPRTLAGDFPMRWLAATGRP